MSDYIRLSTGSKFFFRDFSISDVNIENVAKGLAKNTRFNGQTPGWDHYSIAEHSINVSKLVPKKHRFVALMHDAAEAFMGDMTTPLKVYCQDYKKLETKLDAFLAGIYGYEYPFPPEVKEADYKMFILEYRTFFKDVVKFNSGETDPIETTLPIKSKLIKFEYLQPIDAYAAFLERYYELGGK